MLELLTRLPSTHSQRGGIWHGTQTSTLARLGTFKLRQQLTDKAQKLLFQDYHGNKQRRLELNIDDICVAHADAALEYSPHVFAGLQLPNLLEDMLRLRQTPLFSR